MKYLGNRVMECTRAEFDALPAYTTVTNDEAEPLGACYRSTGNGAAPIIVRMVQRTPIERQYGQCLQVQFVPDPAAEWQRALDESGRELASFFRKEFRG